MTSTTTNNIRRHEAARSPEEEAILGRFWSRVSCGTRKAAHALSHGSFLVL